MEDNINDQKPVRAESPQASNNNPMPETPEEFYEYYQKKMSDQTPIQPITYSTGPVKKNKSPRKISTAMITIFLLIGVGTAAFAFRNTVLNTFALLTKNPANYYLSIEKTNLNVATNLIRQVKTNDNTAHHTSVEFTLNRDSTNSFLKKYTQTGLVDVESELGITLKSLKLDQYTAYQNKQYYEKLGLNINKTNVISAQAYLDNNNITLQLPELSPAYLKISQSDNVAGSGMLFSSKPTNSKELADFIDRYGNIVFEHIKNVSIDKNSKLTRGDISVNCSKLTATIDSKAQENIEAAILKTAKSDNYIIDKLPIFHTTKAEYIKTVDKLLADFNGGKTGSDRKDIKMAIYVDRSGKIIGRDIEVSRNGNYSKTFSYSLLDKNNKTYISLNVYDDKGKSTLTISGNSVKKNGANEGTLTITSPSNKDMKYTMNFSSSDEVQKCKMAIALGDSSIATINTKVERLKEYKIPKISETDKIYDFMDASSYLKTIDTKEYINDLSKKLGLKKKLLNNLLSNIN